MPCVYNKNFFTICQSGKISFGVFTVGTFGRYPRRHKRKGSRSPEMARSREGKHSSRFGQNEGTSRRHRRVSTNVSSPYKCKNDMRGIGAIGRATTARRFDSIELRIALYYG